MADLWKLLHLRALNFKEENDLKFLLEFSTKIPKYNSNCACKEHWLNWVRQNPPPFGPNFGEKYFAWTVSGHNAINKLLDKPEYSIESAREYYNKFLNF